MNAATWAAWVVPALTVGGATLIGVSKLTRMAVAIEQLAEALKGLSATDSDHERRIALLERSRPRRQ